MLVLIIVVVAVLLGGYGYTHRGRHAFGFSRRGRSGK